MPDDVVVAPHQNTPHQAVQAAEGAAREGSPHAIPPNERAVALQGTEGDGAPQDPGAAPVAAAEPDVEPARAKPIAKSLSDVKRDEINARFRNRRTQANAEEKDDITEFARTAGLPPEFAPQEPEPVAAAEPEPAPAAAEPAAPEVRKIKLKVHGQDIELPESEVIAKAQIALASDNVLEEAKGKVRQLDDLIADVRNRATRPAQEGTNQAPQNATQTADAPATEQPLNQEDPFGKLIETMQFGDPEEAKALLRNTIVQTAQQVSRQTTADDRIREDGMKAAQVLADFRAKHKELAEDPMANAAIEAKIIQLQADDLKALNVDLTRLRKDGRPATPADIANVHQEYRSRKYPVRSAEQMLETATGEFLKWRPTSQSNPADPAPQPAPQPAPAAQRNQPLEVVVDRAARKAAIPQQPSRTTAPRSEPAAPAPRSRSAIVQNMKAVRAAKRGQNLGLGQGG